MVTEKAAVNIIDLKYMERDCSWETKMQMKEGKKELLT